jgi:hypothetical protein
MATEEALSTFMRVTEPWLDVKLGPISLIQNNPLLSDRPSLGRRAWRSLARVLMITMCVGTVATLVWEFYGDAAKQTIARQQPGSSSLPSTNQPPSPEIAIEQPSPPAVQRSAQEAVAAQAATDPTVPAVPFKLPSLEALQLEMIARNLAAVRQNVEAVRQNVEQLAAGQEQMVRDIAKLQNTEQDIRHMISAPPSRPTAPPRKPVPAVAGPPKSSAAPLTSALGH